MSASLLKLRRHVSSLREIASAVGKLDKVQAFNSVIASIDRQLKSRHDKIHDRRQQ
jgi:hypothetical protein